MRQRSKNIAITLWTLIFIFFTPVANSQVTPYIAAEVGAAYWDADFLDDDLGLTVTVGLGLRLVSNIAIETAYQNFGTMNFVAGSTEGELEAESASFAARFVLPTSDKFKPFVFAGAEKMRYTEQNDGDQDIFDQSEDTEATFGFGLSITQDEQSAIRITLASHADGDIIRLSAGGALDF